MGNRTIARALSQRSRTPRASAPAITPADPAMEERDPEQVPQHTQREPGPRPHPRTAPIAPLDRHDRDPVAAAAREVDQLDVEDDAADPLAREEVVGGRQREALEAALGVLHGPHDPGRRDEVEDPPKEPAIR